MKITAEFNSMEEMQEFAKTVVCGVQVPAEKPKPTKKKEPASEEKPSPATQEPTTSDAAPGKTFTKEEVRAKLAALNRAGKKEKVRELLKEFGVTTLPEVKPEDYPALMAKAGEL